MGTESVTPWRFHDSTAPTYSVLPSREEPSARTKYGTPARAHAPHSVHIDCIEAQGSGTMVCEPP